MTLSDSTAQRHFFDPFVLENVACGYDRCDVMAFESLMLTPFCMEKLSVRKWIFQCFNDDFSAILFGIR